MSASDKLLLLNVLFMYTLCKTKRNHTVKIITKLGTKLDGESVILFITGFGLFSKLTKRITTF